MPFLQVLADQEMMELLTAAVSGKLSAVLTYQVQNRWANAKTLLFALGTEGIAIELPAEWSLQLPPGTQVALTFRLRQKKFHLVSDVIRQSSFKGASGEAKMLILRTPTKIECLNRRQFERVEVPADKIVRVSFWLGGRSVIPTPLTPEHPVFSGRVMDLNAHGFLVRTNLDAMRMLDVGETVGVRLIFEEDKSAFFANAQLRHTKLDGDMVLIGLQFDDLTRTEEGLQALGTLISKMNSYKQASAAAHAG